METSNIEKNIVGVIDALLKSAETEREEFINSNQDFINELQKIKQKQKSNYSFIEYLDIFIFSKFNNLISATMSIPPSNKNTYIIRNIINGNYDHFFRRYIEDKEGSSCSVDKVRFIINKLIKSLIENKNLSLYATYEGCERIDKSEWNEQAYWSPETIKDTDEAFKLFNDWYYFKSN